MNLDRILSVVTAVVAVGTLLLGVAGYIHLSGVSLGNIQGKLEVLDARLQAMDTRLQAVEASVKDVRAEVKDVRAEVQDVRAEVQDVRAHVKKIDDKLDSLAVRQAGFEGELKLLKANQVALAAKLKTLDENVKNIDRQMRDLHIGGRATTPSE